MSCSLFPCSLADDLASYLLEKIETVKWGISKPPAVESTNLPTCFLSSLFFFFFNLFIFGCVGSSLLCTGFL